MIESPSAVLTTPAHLRQVEHDLLAQSGGVTVGWCGRAATALYWAYKLAIKRKPVAGQPEIIMPAIMCGTPANAAHLAAAAPRFADTDPNTGLVTLPNIQARVTANTCAVVVVHLFGQTVDMRPIADWCDQQNITLIEDTAQALGARLPDGSPVGSIGDMAVYSFNKTKILESGGGALVVKLEHDRHGLENLLQADPLPGQPDPALIHQFSLSYRNLHHSLVALRRMQAAPEAIVSESFMRLRPAYDRLYRTGLPQQTRLGEDWTQLPNLLSRRLVRARLYAKLLDERGFHLLNGWEESGVCWRFSLLVEDPEVTVPLSERVRTDGFHVSNLYWPANQLFRPADVCPNADYFGRRILNLWVDDTVDEDWIERCCDSLKRHGQLVSR